MFHYVLVVIFKHLITWLYSVTLQYDHDWGGGGVSPDAFVDSFSLNCIKTLLLYQISLPRFILVIR